MATTKKKSKIDWAAYEKALKQRGSITFWLENEVADYWYAKPNGKPGGQAKYSDTAIDTMLNLRLVFHQALRQTEGLAESIFAMMNVKVDSPDHTTLSRRSGNLKISSNLANPSESLTIIIDSTGLEMHGAGEWNQKKHGPSKRRNWRKLHLTIDSQTLEIVKASLTKKEQSHPVEALEHIDSIESKVDEFLGDGAYDSKKIYDAIGNKSDQKASVTVPPPKGAVVSKEYESNPTQRDKHVEFIDKHGREAWECANNFKRRLLVENAMGRYKQIIGPKLRARKLENQEIEALVACKALNKMVRLGTPTRPI